MLKIKIKDKVKIVSGKDKGREGEVEVVFPKKCLLVVGGINIYKKHVKGSQGQKGGIYDIPRPISLSKVALLCPKCKKATRVSFKVIDGKKTRFCKKCKKQIDSKE
jgi:large subunit ribosomal protein L24